MILMMYIWTIVSYQLVKFSQTVAYVNVYVVTDNVRFELLQSIELFLAFIEDQFVTKLCVLYNFCTIFRSQPCSYTNL